MNSRPSFGYCYLGAWLLLVLFLLSQFVVRQLEDSVVATQFVYYYSLISAVVLLFSLVMLLFSQRRWWWVLLPVLLLSGVAFWQGLDVWFMAWRLLAQPVLLALILSCPLYLTWWVIRPRLALYSWLLSWPALLLVEYWGLLSGLPWLLLCYGYLVWCCLAKTQAMVLLAYALFSAGVVLALGLNLQECLALLLLGQLLLLWRWQRQLLSQSSRLTLLASGSVIALLWCGLLLISLFALAPVSVLVLLLLCVLVWWYLLGAVPLLFGLGMVGLASLGWQLLLPTDASVRYEIPPVQPGLPYQWQALKLAADPIKFHDASARWGQRPVWLFFGSDTHGRDYDNQVRRFDLSTGSWHQDQAPTPSWLVAYSSREGLYVPSWSGRIRPVTMHGYDQVTWLPQQNCLAVLALPLHHLPNFALPERPQLPRLWCYQPETKQWISLSVGGATPRLFSGSLVATPAGELYALGHHQQPLSLLPIGGEAASPRAGLYHWRVDQGWRVVDSQLTTGPQLVAEWQPDTQTLVILDDGARSIRLFNPATQHLLRLPIEPRCIQQQAYPPLTATAGAAGLVYFLARQGAQTALCVVDVPRQQVRWLQQNQQTLPMNFHLHYDAGLNSLLIFQRKPDDAQLREVWLMSLDQP